MKKIFIFIAAMVMTANMMNANAQNADFQLSINENGAASISSALEQKLADTRRHECIQLSTGEVKEVEVDGFYLGINAGAQAMFSGLQSNGFQAVAPTASVSFGFEGGKIGRKRNAAGELHAIRRMSGELEVGATIRKYDPTAYTAGQKYWSYYANVKPAFALIDNRWVQHRLDLVGCVGYLYSKDNSHVVEVETATSIDNYYVYYTGSGLTFGGGLKYSFRPSMTTGRIGLSVMYKNIPVVRLNETVRENSIEVTLSYTFGMFRNVKR